jgi:hypothetical protein
MMRAFIGRLAHAEPGFDVNHAAQSSSARVAPALPGLDEGVSGALFDLERSAERTGFRRDGLAPVRAAQRPEPVARRRSQPMSLLRRISPMSLVRRVRMRHAADLLTANALSIDQVGLRHVVERKGSSA